MLKNVLTSVLAGGLLLLAGVYVALAPATTGTGNVAPKELAATSGKALAGSGKSRDDAFHLRLDDAGNGILILPASNLRLDDYPYVQVDFRSAIAVDRLVLMWQVVHPKQQTWSAPLPYNAGKTIRLDMADTPGWRGNAASLALYIAGESGQLVALERITLEGPSFGRYLETAWHNWIAYRPWTNSSINHQSGVAQPEGALHPVPILAALFLLGAAVYGLRLKLAGSGRRFDPRVIAVLFLVSWLVCDLAWQANLLQQLAISHSRFAGKSLDEKLRSGPDRALYGFTRDAIPLIDAPDARVFVGSANEYLAMRVAYYFYPLNVFWERHAEELPAREYLSRGDYLALVYPTRLRVDERGGYPVVA